jgi:hypothetical protein
MTAVVQKLAEEVRSLPPEELDEFLNWLADYELESGDAWDREIERDSQSGGRLDSVLKRARADISAGKTKPLDQILHNA